MIAHRFLGGEGRPPCVILHGLLGSSRNWITVGRKLSGHFCVFALDARNHGESPHHPQMDYSAMVADLEEWRTAELGDQRFLLIGHSMGGKTAMRYACEYPQFVERLVVADIAVRQYQPRWQTEFAIMRRMPLADMKSRGEAEKWLEAEGVTDWAFRKFLVTNIDRNEEGQFCWIINLEVLQQNLPELFMQPISSGDRFTGPVLWLRGERSNFVVDSDEEMILQHFPNARFETIAGAGHNVHFDKMDAFIEAVTSP